MLVSIKAILLSGTGALVAAGVVAGLGAGVGVVCGRVWPTTAKVIEVIKTNVAKITFFIASPEIALMDFYPQITQIYAEKEKGTWDWRLAQDVSEAKKRGRFSRGFKQWNLQTRDQFR